MWCHVTRFLHGLQFPVETTVALYLDASCVLAYHRTFGATLIDLGWILDLDEDDPSHQGLSSRLTCLSSPGLI